MLILRGKVHGMLWKKKRRSCGQSLPFYGRISHFPKKVQLLRAERSVDIYGNGKPREGHAAMDVCDSRFRSQWKDLSRARCVHLPPRHHFAMIWFECQIRSVEIAPCNTLSRSPPIGPCPRSTDVIYLLSTTAFFGHCIIPADWTSSYLGQLEFSYPYRSDGRACALRCSCYIPVRISKPLAR